MKKLLFITLILLTSCTTTVQTIKSGTRNTNTPEDFGFSSDVFVQMIQTIKKEKLNVNSILITKDGQTVLNANFYPQKPSYLHDVASVSKSITSLMIGVAIDEGHIQSEKQNIVDFFPKDAHLFENISAKQITIEQLLTMSSSICSDFRQGETLREKMKTKDEPLKEALANLSSSQNEKFVYCSVGVQILSMIISKATGMTLEEYTIKKLFKPLNITDYRFATDQNGDTNASGDIFLTAESLNKIGVLILNEGKYNGKQVISKDWIQKSTSPQIKLSQEELYGFLWWLREDLGGLIEGQGRGGQRLIILPKKKLVVVMFGTGFSNDKVGGYIAKALKSDTKIPNNPKGYTSLKEELKSIQKPYNLLTPKPIPALANEVYGKKYIFQKNEAGLTHFILNSKENALNQFTIALKTDNGKIETREIPLAIDGTYKVSKATRFQTFMAARALWTDEKSIFIDYNEFSNAHKYNINIRFDENKAIFSIQDEADYGEPTTISAKRETLN
ncbi:serine hydrolase domain-containing protein [Bernardetia sp. OM2101]|uniref:serine hydrolase domain-containing protein n=1 Tax=Bernardetia sp. OM2101 TaxID=3344876 RepID=UPI0035CFC2DD